MTEAEQRMSAVAYEMYCELLDIAEDGFINGLSSDELGRALDRAPTNVNKNLKRIEQAGYLERLRVQTGQMPNCYFVYEIPVKD